MSLATPDSVAVVRPYPDGVRFVPLVPHDDDRGRVLEIHRDEWGIGERPTQWNFVRSRPGTLRGVHAHLDHWDLLHCVAGAMAIGLRDLRPASPSFGTTAVVDLSADAPALLSIPPGIAHGFWFAAEAGYVYALSNGWNPADELGCRWDDPELGIPWGAAARHLSPRDATAGTMRAMAAVVSDHFRKVGITAGS